MLHILPVVLLACAPAQEPAGSEPGNWSGAANAGVTILDGNNESTTATADITTKYEESGYRWIFEGNYAGVRNTDQATGDADTTSRLYRLAAEHHRFLDDEDNLYLYGKGSARQDRPNGLDVREDIGAGLGYTWRWGDRNQSSFSLESGPSVLKENQVGLPSGDVALNGRAAARYQNPFAADWLATARAEFFQSFDDSDDRSATGEVGLRWNFENTWFLQGTVAVAWDNTPAPGFDKADYRYVLSIGTTF